MIIRDMKPLTVESATDTAVAHAANNISNLSKQITYILPSIEHAASNISLLSQITEKHMNKVVGEVVNVSIQASVLLNTAKYELVSLSLYFKVLMTFCVVFIVFIIVLYVNRVKNKKNIPMRKLHIRL